MNNQTPISIKIITTVSMILSVLLILLSFLPIHEAPPGYLIFTLIAPITVIIGSILLRRSNKWGIILFSIGAVFLIGYTIFLIYNILNPTMPYAAPGAKPSFTQVLLDGPHFLIIWIFFIPSLVYLWFQTGLFANKAG